MIKHILKLIWNQRRANVWLFLEILLVTAILWVMLDALLVDTYTYHQPTGFDIENVYEVKLAKRNLSTDSTQSDGESLLRLAENLRQMPGVTDVALMRSACPYLWNTMFASLVSAEDTARQVELSRLYCVTPDYFKLFRMRDANGDDLYSQVMSHEGDVVLSKELSERLFNSSFATGKAVKWTADSNDQMRIAAVSSSIAQSDFDRPGPCWFALLRTDQEVLDDYNQWNDLSYFQCAMRMRDGFKPERMADFLQAQGDRLEVGDIYVSSVSPVSDYRTDRLKSRLDNQKKKSALVGFMLVNIFFGIVGTFWLRTQSRRMELGLRAAIGASKRQLRLELLTEGLILLLATLPFILLFIVNMLLMDLPDTYRLDYTWWRFLAVLLAVYLLMGGMICLGIHFPAGRIARMNPAEALHDE